MLRPNRVKEKIQRGELCYGISVSWASPDLVEFLGLSGFDWIFIDAEHAAIGPESLAEIVRACYLHNMVPFYRVPENNPALILSALETGVLGIIVPHVKTADEARAIVQAVRYPPHGTRGAGSGTRPANYGLTQTPAEYFEWANNNIMTYLNIEDPEGMQNLDEILAVDGIDIIGIGDGDLALIMGYPGQRNHPEVAKVVKEAEKKILASNIVLSKIAGDAAGREIAVESGALMTLGSVPALLTPSIKSLMGK